MRELLGAPARFSELQTGLPGIAKNLLTTRLRQLEEDGVVRRVQSQGVVHYTLTEHGAAIRPILEQLGYWGTKLPRVAPPIHDRSVRATAMALQAIVARASNDLPEERQVVELEIDDGHLEFVLGPQPTVTARSSIDPDARLQAPTSAIVDYLDGHGLDRKRFAYVSGDRGARSSLMGVLAAMA
jgi:DNA-binding HxlR family transcriptional regulator